MLSMLKMLIILNSNINDGKNANANDRNSCVTVVIMACSINESSKLNLILLAN